MNAMTQSVVCSERILVGLTEEMKFVAKSTIYSSSEARVGALSDQYKKHMFIQGNFSSEKNSLGGDELFFHGKICGTKHTVRIF